jgi:hypothetical protein
VERLSKPNDLEGDERRHTMSHEAIGWGAQSNLTGRYAGDMSVIRVEIPEEVAERLATEAAERGTSTENIAAEVLIRHIPDQSSGYRVPRFVGKGHSGRHDLSMRVEEILGAEFGA